MTQTQNSDSGTNLEIPDSDLSFEHKINLYPEFVLSCARAFYKLKFIDGMEMFDNWHPSFVSLPICSGLGRGYDDCLVNCIKATQCDP